MKQILTIAIPTYNRPEQIQKQVRLLLPQLEERIILVVYDNCSPIPVKDLFRDDELSEFNLIRNSTNIGGDANIARCFEYCTTPWLWTLSDDDLVKPDAVELVLADIAEHSDSTFINYNSLNYFKTIGFEELSHSLRNENVFGNSFAMASCLYNINKLKSYLLHYYNNLSSNLGTLILVLKYVQKHNESVCVFLVKTPIAIYNSAVGWNYGSFIKRSKQFIDAFDDKKSNLKGTLFLGCHKVNYTLIIMDRKESNMSYSQRWGALICAIRNQGILNALRYSPKLLIFTFLYLTFQHESLNWIVKIMKRVKSGVVVKY